MKNLIRVVAVAIMAAVSTVTISNPAKATEPTCLSSEYQTLLDANWAYNKDYLAQAMRVRLGNGDSYVLYDVQVLTNNLLDMARKCDDRQKIDELSSLYLIAYDYLLNYTVDANGNKVYYADGHYEWHCTTSACVQWSTNKYTENYITSSQFVYLLSRTMNTIAHIPTSERTANMNLLVSKYQYAVNRWHLHRWITTSTQFAPLGGCSPATGVNHQVRMTNLRAFAYTGPAYCNAIRDMDLWIMASAMEMGEANVADPVTFNYTQPFKDILHNYLVIATDTVDWTHFAITRQKVSYSGLTVNVINMDPGAWRTYPDYAYAGYEGLVYPTDANKTLGPTDMGWDISHSRRLVHALMTMYEKKSYTGSAFPSDSFMKAFAYQVAYVSFDGNFASCKVYNFMGGANGWYRVGYAGQAGTPPYGLTKALLTGGYGFYANQDVNLKRLMATAWKRVSLMPDSDPDKVLWGFNNANLTTSVDVLQTLPSLIYTDPSFVVN